MKWIMIILNVIAFIILTTFTANAQEPPKPHLILKGTPSRQEFGFNRSFITVPGDYRLLLKGATVTLPEGMGSNLFYLLSSRGKL